MGRCADQWHLGIVYRMPVIRRAHRDRDDVASLSKGNPMRTRLFLLIGCIAALTACSSTSTGPAGSNIPVSTSSASTAASTAAPSGTTFVLGETVNASSYTTKGAGAKPGGPTGEPADGDVWAFSSVLQRDGKNAGTDHVVITFGAAGTAVVDAVETLAAGRIVGHGTAPFQPTLAIPVVSGTGAYAGATGTVTIVSKDNTHSDLTIALR